MVLKARYTGATARYEGGMKKRTGGPKKTAPKKDEEWFRRKVAELKAELDKLPAERQEQFRRELEEGKEH